MAKKIIDIKNLKTYFYTEGGIIKAVDDVSFDIQRGETLGVVGESGCGKSVTARSIMLLIPKPRGKIVGGSINYLRKDNKCVDITSLKSNSPEIRSIRGNEISMIFQEPMTSLNPVYTIGEQIMEVVLTHNQISKKDARKRAIEMLDLVGISAPTQRVDEYPYQLSGGMRQRAMIAMALACNPKFLIADEPTTALDVTIEAQILELIQKLQDELGMSIMFITHDLGVIGEITDKVVVMYTGKVVERAYTDDIFYNPKHPYTCGLLKSRPRIGKKKRLLPIKGSVPNLLHLPQGCYFAPRCPEVKGVCTQKDPPTFKITDDHYVKCWLYGDEKEVSPC